MMIYVQSLSKKESSSIFRTLLTDFQSLYFTLKSYHFRENPFKKVTIMDTNCMAKAGMVTVAGYAMGLALGFFMNAMEIRDVDY